MSNTTDDVMRLEREFKACHKVLNALGDETRQYLICVMLKIRCGGQRLVYVSKITKLFPPAGWRQLQVPEVVGASNKRKGRD